MEENRETYSEANVAMPMSSLRSPNIIMGAAKQDKFSVSSYTLNKIVNDMEEEKIFPGNIAPEGYFYSPFHEIKLKELDDEIHELYVKRINFDPLHGAGASTSSVTMYDPSAGTFETGDISVITIVSPVSYDFTIGQPFSIYDVMEDMTYRGHLDAFSTNPNGTCTLTITTTAKINSNSLAGGLANGKSGYIISMLEENAPEYAEFVPSSQKLIWRGPKKMSELTSDSPLYNMPFTNGRLYVHKNINVFVRRQDPHNDFHIFKPAFNNPLRRFQVEGNAKLSLDYYSYIIDSMVDSC